MAPGFSIRGFAESMRGKMTEELTRLLGESAKDLLPIIYKQYRWWEKHLAEVQEAPGKLSISCHSEDSNGEAAEHHEKTDEAKPDQQG
jgi:hypothetical protein